jgi:membrane-associated phospholipid phosphatase
MRKHGASLGIALTLAVLFSVRDAAAEQAPPPAASGDSQATTPSDPAKPRDDQRRSAELKYNLWIDIPVTAASAAFVIVTELDKTNLAPKSCNWCEIGSDGSDNLNGFDAWFRNALVRRDTSVAASTSDAFAYGVAPVTAITFLAMGAQREDQSLRNTPVDLLLVAEATGLAMDVNQIVKLAVSRERPYLHFASPEARATAGPDAALSFYSLHTSATFSLAVSAGTVASMRGYSIAPLIWASGILIGTATGYMRIAADKHYMTDTLTGAAVGSLVGFSVPYFFHKPIASRIRVSAHPEPGGGTIGASGTF